MQRSWVALGVVIVIIVAAIAIALRSQPRTTTTPKPTEGQPGETPTPKATTATPAEPKEKEKGEEKEKEKEKAPVEPPTKEFTPAEADAVLKDADAKIAAGQLAEAQKLLSAALLSAPKIPSAAEFKTRLTKLSEGLIFSDRACPLSVAHVVVAGDALEKLARKHKTTIELIRRINGLKGDIIRPGQRLKVIPGGFDVLVDKSDFRLTVTKGGIWVREFKVGLGKNGTTPLGEFVAGHKLREPTYFGDGSPIPFGDKKNNPLGTRWITVQAEYGIHGTWEPESMGKEESKGCVRMRNEDVEWLFDLIVPGSSRIVIHP